MSVSYTSPKAFAQSIRQRRRAIQSERVLLVVEGASDKRALFPLLDDGVFVVPANGKEMLLGAYSALQGEGLTRCLYLVDCDGSLEAKWRGMPDLIISQNRDMEADLLFQLDAFSGVSREYLAHKFDSVGQLRPVAAQKLEFCAQLTAQVGMVLDAARAKGLPTRVVDGVTNKRRKVELRDVDGFEAWVSKGELPPSPVLLGALGDALGWLDDDKNALDSIVALGGHKLCRAHSTASCAPCQARRFSNGHHLVETLAQVLRSSLGRDVSVASAAEATRMSLDPGRLSAWDVVARIRTWEAASGGVVLSAPA
jgi:hypothetical protein